MDTNHSTSGITRWTNVRMVLKRTTDIAHSVLGQLEQEKVLKRIQPTITRIVKNEAYARDSMVATKDPHATHAGLEVLKAGGNAIDAAVAACFAIGVVEPTSSGIGGGGYLVYQIGDKGGVVGFPMRSPFAAKPDMYSLTGEPSVGNFGWPGVQNDENIEGFLSIATPGAVAGLCATQKLHGCMPLNQVIEPAIKLARDGFNPSWFNLYASGLMAGKLLRFPELQRVFMPDQEMPNGDLTQPSKFRQPELAAVLEAIGKYGAEAFYKGDIAQELVSDIQNNGGILSLRDLSEYRPFIWENGLEFNYRTNVVRVPPYGCAGPTSAMTLQLLNGFELANMKHNSVEMLHTYIGSARLAYIDRFTYLADPAFVDVPWQGMASEEYINRRRPQIGDTAPDRWEAGDPWFEEGRGPETRLPPSQPALDSGTTHLCTIDKDGNAVSLTNTLMSGYGSGIVPKNTGVAMNNGMMWFDPVPDRVNSIQPGKFPLNNMTPALVIGPNGVKIAVGASGGRRITNCVTQLIIKMIDYNMGPQEAIDSPRVDCSTPETSIDSRIEQRVRDGLERRNHKLLIMGEDFVQTGFASFASPVAIVKNPIGLKAGVDTFHSAYASGI